MRIEFKSREFGHAVTAARKARGWTGDKIEALTGISASNIHRLTRSEGRLKSIDVILSLACVLEIDFTKYLIDNGNPGSGNLTRIGE